MTVLKSWALRPTFAVLATLTLSACSTTMPPQSGTSNMEKGSMCMSCPCCSKMFEKKQTDNKKSGCLCCGMMSGKDGCPCCGSSSGNPMMCQPQT